MIGIDICATCLLFAKEIKEVGIIWLSKKPRTGALSQGLVNVYKDSVKVLAMTSCCCSAVRELKRTA